MQGKLPGLRLDRKVAKQLLTKAGGGGGRNNSQPDGPRCADLGCLVGSDVCSAGKSPPPTERRIELEDLISVHLQPTSNPYHW